MEELQSLAPWFTGSPFTLKTNQLKFIAVQVFEHIRGLKGHESIGFSP
jgi:hypothetical protein